MISKKDLNIRNYLYQTWIKDLAELLFSYVRADNTIVTEVYNGSLHALNCYQINLKRERKYNIQYPTFLFDINILEKDKINIVIDYPDKTTCSGLAKILLLSPSGRVIYSFILKADYDQLDAFNDSGKTVNIKFKASPGKYTLKYWANDCEDCYYNISIRSMTNNVDSVGCCGLRKKKKCI